MFVGAIQVQDTSGMAQLNNCILLEVVFFSNSVPSHENWTVIILSPYKFHCWLAEALQDNFWFKKKSFWLISLFQISQ